MCISLNRWPKNQWHRRANKKIWREREKTKSKSTISTLLPSFALLSSSLSSSSVSCVTNYVENLYFITVNNGIETRVNEKNTHSCTQYIRFLLKRIPYKQQSMATMTMASDLVLPPILLYIYSYTNHFHKLLLCV